MHKEQRQKVWPWAALAFLIGPMVFSACSLFGINLARSTNTDPGEQTPTLVYTLAIPSATATVEASPIPATPSPTAAPLLTATPAFTPQQDPTATTSVADLPAARFSVQNGTPRYLQAFTHADLGCLWVGVAGQVFDATGAGASGMVVMVTGSMNGQALQRAARTDVQSPFGPGGYEIFLGDYASNMVQKVSVQLFNQDDQPMSDPFQVDVPDQCDQNLVVVNFNEGEPQQPIHIEGEGNRQVYIPILSR